MEKKMTYVEAITIAMESAELPAEVSARFEDLIQSLTKKSVSKAQQAKIEAREIVKSAIVEGMTSDWMGIADIMAIIPDEYSGMTAGQIVPLLTALRKDGIIEREEIKGKAHYRLASAQ